MSNAVLNDRRKGIKYANVSEEIYSSPGCLQGIYNVKIYCKGFDFCKQKLLSAKMEFLFLSLEIWMK